MQAAISKNKDTRIFFCNLTNTTNYFWRSFQKIKILNEIIKKTLPRTVDTKGNFKS